jgi:hypothetical protein
VFNWIQIRWLAICRDFFCTFYCVLGHCRQIWISNLPFCFVPRVFNRIQVLWWSWSSRNWCFLTFWRVLSHRYEILIFNWSFYFVPRVFNMIQIWWSRWLSCCSYTLCCVLGRCLFATPHGHHICRVFLKFIGLCFLLDALMLFSSSIISELSHF